ncbi:MAG: sensor histidine kinase [Pseudomonadales bacterium]
MDERIDEDLEEDIEEIAELYQDEGLARVKSEIEREVMSGDEDDTFLILLNNDGEVFFSSDLSHWRTLKPDEQAFQRAAANEETVLRTVEVDGQEYPTRIIYGRIGSEVILQIGETVEESEEMLEILLAVFGVMFLLTIPIASFVGWAMARQAVRGIEEVSETAAHIEGGHLDQRVAVKAHGDEIQKLADTFNAMLDRIRDLITEMREMTDNIAHDMRSPLARIRAISEVAVSSAETGDEHKIAASATIEECDRLLQMINATLDVAEAEAGSAAADKQTINISELAKDACELFEPVADEKEIELSCQADAGCRIHGNVHNLQRMLANLLDNALKYTPPKGKIDINLGCDEQGIKVAVADTGVGIPEPDQARIFERFFRCDQSRSKTGCGMGLSFSQAVARAHGGDISVTSEPGNGTTFTITIPNSRIFPS